MLFLLSSDFRGDLFLEYLENLFQPDVEQLLLLILLLKLELHLLILLLHML